ncbi:hypothetical protein FPOAC2_10705 [Fusarium poae]|jgi:hypothetical protein
MQDDSFEAKTLFINSTSPFRSQVPKDATSFKGQVNSSQGQSGEASYIALPAAVSIARVNRRTILLSISSNLYRGSQVRVVHTVPTCKQLVYCARHSKTQTERNDLLYTVAISGNAVV